MNLAVKVFTWLWSRITSLVLCINQHSKKARTLNYQEKTLFPSVMTNSSTCTTCQTVRSAQSKTSISAHSSFTYNTSSILVTICSAHARSFSRVTRSLSLSASSLVSSLSAKVSPMLRFCLKGLGGKSQLAENKTSCLDSPGYKFLGQVKRHVSSRPTKIGF